MREAEIPDKRSILRSWLFWGLLSCLISAVVVTLWIRFTPASAQVGQVIKAEEALSPLQALQLRVDAGDPEAQRLMAIRFLSGDGVLRSAEESKKLYDLSVSGGNAQAMYELACLHDTGTTGFPRDAAMAWNLYFRAAKAGQINAMAYISEAYEGGPAKDFVSSYAWRSLAIHLSQLPGQRANLSFKVDGSLGWMGITHRYEEYLNDPCYYKYNSLSAVLIVSSHEKWLERISGMLSDADILLAQKRSRELLAEIEAKKAKK